MGADRAIHVDIPAKDYEALEPFHVSKILAQLAKDEKVDIVIVGKQVSYFFFFLTFAAAESVNVQIILFILILVYLLGTYVEEEKIFVYFIGCPISS